MTSPVDESAGESGADDGFAPIGSPLATSTALLDRDDARTDDAPTGAPARPSAQRDLPPGIVPIGEVPPVIAPVRPHRLLREPPTDRMLGWIVTAVVTLIGGVVRFVNIGLRTDGGTPLFDEKYYAIHAAEMIRNGGFEDNPAYNLIVHPPLGKQLIAIGQLMFGYTPLGWRFASAVAGTICIFLMVRVARRMTGSTLLGGIAGVLLIADGLSHVQSRAALLDIFQALFVLGAFACIVADRDQVRARLAASLEPGSDERGAGTRFGIKLGARWWRFAAGVQLGLLCAVKWSGAYWVAGFGLLVLIWDIQARRSIGVRRPVVAGLARDLLPNVWALGVVPVLTYIGTWWAWFASESAWARHLVESSGGFFSASWAALKSQYLYVAETLKFHTTLLTPKPPDQPHPWESKPWTWPMSTRPVLYYVGGGEGTTGCGEGITNCDKRIILVGTPALWWIALFVLAWALWKAIARLDWRYCAVLTAYGAGFVPWFANIDRQMYLFYMTPLAPFLILGVTLVLGDILGSRHAGVERRFTSIAVVALYVGLVVANFIFFWPILNGDPITPERLQMTIWLPSMG